MEIYVVNHTQLKSHLFPNTWRRRWRLIPIRGVGQDWSRARHQIDAADGLFDTTFHIVRSPARVGLALQKLKFL